MLTELGASVFQMIAAHILDTISLLPGMARAANDAVPAYTRVKMKDAPKLLKLPETECSTIWIKVFRRRPAMCDKVNCTAVLVDRKNTLLREY